MGSIGIPDSLVSLPEISKAGSWGNVPLSNRKLVTEQNISDLRKIFSKTDDGSVLVVPGDEGYDDTITRWSRTAERRAGVSLLPKSAKTISSFVQYASLHNLDLAVRGGGHSTAGASSTLGGLLIDLASMRGVTVNPESKTLAVQGGAQWSDVDDEAWKHGLATVGGTVGDTGVGGLTLGGGFGWLNGTHGLVIDNLISCEVCLASGEIVRASKDENADLFWALRGAGHNFGVVTEFVLRAWPQSNVWAGHTIFTTDKLKEIVEVLNEVIVGMEGRGACGLAFGRPPPAGGQVVVLVAIVYDGTKEEGQARFKRLLELGPIMNTVDSVPYNTVNRMLNVVPGSRVSVKGASFFLPLRFEFVKSTLEKYTQFSAEVPDAAKTLLLYDIMDTAKIREVGNTEMSFAHRGAHLNAMIAPVWESEEHDTKCRQWAREVAEMFKVELKRGPEEGQHADVEKEAVGFYGNYDQLDQKPRDAFGRNYARLQQLKAHFDPENMFNKLFPIDRAL